MKFDYISDKINNNIFTKLSLYSNYDKCIIKNNKIIDTN